MQLKTLLVAAGAAAVSARPHNSVRQANTTATPVFHVTDFSAACIPHSALCSYDFHVYQPGSIEAYFNGSVQCNATVVSNGALPAIPEGTCTDSSRTWSIMTGADADGGLYFQVSQPVTPISNQTGGHAIPAVQLNYTQTGASRQQVYTGPKEFDLY